MDYHELLPVVFPDERQVLLVVAARLVYPPSEETVLYIVPLRRK